MWVYAWKLLCGLTIPSLLGNSEHQHIIDTTKCTILLSTHFTLLDLDSGPWSIFHVFLPQYNYLHVTLSNINECALSDWNTMYQTWSYLQCHTEHSGEQLFQYFVHYFCFRVCTVGEVVWSLLLFVSLIALIMHVFVVQTFLYMDLMFSSASYFVY